MIEKIIIKILSNKKMIKKIKWNKNIQNQKDNLINKLEIYNQN